MTCLVPHVDFHKVAYQVSALSSKPPSPVVSHAPSVHQTATFSRGFTCTVSTRPPRFSVVLLSQSVHQTVTFFCGFAFIKCPLDHKNFRGFYFHKLCIRPPRFSVVSLSQTVHQTKIRMCVWWSLCTLHLQACQVRVTVGHSGLCCCTSATYFER